MKEPLFPSRRQSTNGLRALYPFVAGGGLGAAGPFIGRDSEGARFFIDPWELYRLSISPNPHWLVLGSLRMGKSSLIKSYCFRQIAFGRWAFILDPKGEYLALAEATGGRVIRLAPGGGVTVNPFAGLEPREQEEILLAVARAVLGRDVDALEAKALSVALQAAGSEPLLPAIVDALLWPADDAAQHLGGGVTMPMLQEAGRAAGFRLQQLVGAAAARRYGTHVADGDEPGDGRLGGMFDAPTSPGLNRLADVTVLDLSAIWLNHRDALDVVMLLADGWFRSLAANRRRKGIYVVDEGWALLRNERVAEGLQAGYKLVSQDGVQRIMIMHGLTDLDSAGEAGSRTRELAKGLVRDSGVKVIYQQPPHEARFTAEILRLNGIEERVVRELARFTGLWKIGDLDGKVVRYLRDDETEEVFTNTDSRMLDELV